MHDLDRRLAALSPQQRLLLERRLQERGIHLPTSDRIPKRSQPDNLPLSFAQTRLWFIQQLDPDNIAYNLATALHLYGEFNAAVLEKALNEIVRRHEILRTRFCTDSQGQPIQQIVPNLTLSIPIVDLTQAETDREIVWQCVRQEASRPFDLTRAPLMRLKLLHLGDREWVLSVVLHHLICDRWSVGVLVRELSALYNAFLHGQPSPLANLPVQYGDYALWQRDWLQGEALDRQLAYWRQQLDDAPPVLDLPGDRPRPAIQTYRGAREPIALSKSLSQALKRLCVEEGATPYMVLLSAFNVLLYRYTNRADIVVGTDIANRDRREIEGAIGLFFNTLVLRTDLSGNPTFRELLARVREVALGAYAHQELPFEKLVEALNPERSLSRMPLYQVKFDLQQAPVRSLELSGLTVTPFPVENGTTKFDLRFNLQDTADGIAGEVEYSSDLFDAATVRRIVAHFQTLLARVTDHPDRPLSALSLLTPDEREQQQQWNCTEADYPSHRCVHQLLSDRARDTPEAIAVECGSERLTYRQLDRRANQLAHDLQRQGVGPETVVGIYCDRSVAMMVGLLGVLKAGGTYLPLDPAFPRDRLAFILADANASIVVTQQHRAAELPQTDAKVTCLDRDGSDIAAWSDRAPDPAITPDNLAYIIYTSGSTGQPKGVEIPHRALTNFLCAMGSLLQISDRDVWLAVTTIAFDIAALELYLPLLVGARLVIAVREACSERTYRATATDGTQLARTLDACGATLVQATPATWTMLLASGWRGRDNLVVLCGGEALNGTVAAQLQQRCAVLWNLYGPTETTIWSTAYRVESADDGIVPIGYPIANTQIHLLDSDLQPVPVGVPGEMYVGGAGLARGYRHRPHLSAANFIANPHSSDPGARLYKTGDLARYRSDGAIAFLGRLDRQVKRRGYRIELGEIEAALIQHPDIAEAAVVMGEELVAYLVAANDTVPSMGQLRQFLRQTLPDYMLPDRAATLDALPRTPNGKLDRRSLPDPDRTRSSDREFVAPRTPTETALADIWAQVLNLEAIGIRDNFFELGGHSLSATQVSARVRERFGVELPLQDFFAEPTVAHLADCLDRCQTDTSPTPTEDREELEL